MEELMSGLTKAKVKELIGVEPRKVHYCLWNDAENTRSACELLHVVECKDDEEAEQKAKKFYKEGREVYHNTVTLYSHHRYEYYQREGVFIPTVFTFISTKMPASWKARYGYFVSRWSLDHHSGTRDIAGKLNCNFYSIKELDSEEHLNDTHLCSGIDRIYSKYAPK